MLLFAVTVLLALVTYILFEAPYRSLFRYYLESPRIISFMLPITHANGGNKPIGNGGLYSKQSMMMNLNPNFLFSPHYNLVTNINSRTNSEASSLANYSLANQSTAVSSSTNTAPNTDLNKKTLIPKSISSVSMAPNGEIERDFNNNKNPGEAY